MVGAEPHADYHSRRARLHQMPSAAPCGRRWREVGPPEGKLLAEGGAAVDDPRAELGERPLEGVEPGAMTATSPAFAEHIGGAPTLRASPRRYYVWMPGLPNGNRKA